MFSWSSAHRIEYAAACHSFLYWHSTLQLAHQQSKLDKSKSFADMRSLICVSLGQWSFAYMCVSGLMVVRLYVCLWVNGRSLLCVSLG